MSDMEESDIGRAGELTTSVAGNEIVGPKTPGGKLIITVEANHFNKILSCPRLMAP
jgi:hypothetical protein